MGVVDGKIKYEFSAMVWQYAGPAAWYFVTLPGSLSAEIRTNLGWQEEGWGRLKAQAKIGNSQWETAIWFDRKRNAYLMPIKAEIRKKESLAAGNEIGVSIWV
jgi:hypothetical protein